MTRWHHLFISYAHVDQDIAFKIADALEQFGVEIWIDEDIEGGQEWSADIARAIRTARAVLLIASSRSLSRPIVKKEIYYASEENKPIVPVFIEKTSIPDDLKLHLSGPHRLFLNRINPTDQIPSILRALSLLNFDVIQEQMGVPGTSLISEINKRFIEPSYFELLKMSPVELRKKISNFTKIIEAKPDQGYAHLNLGLVYLFLKNYPAAERCFRKACHCIPDEPDAYYYLAISLCGGRHLGVLRMPEIKQIQDYIHTSIHLDDKREVYYYMLAFIYYEYYAVHGLRIPGPDPEDLLKMARAQDQDEEEVERFLDSVNIKSRDLIAIIRNR